METQTKKNQQIFSIWNEIYSKLTNYLHQININYRQDQNPYQAYAMPAIALLIKNLYNEHNANSFPFLKKEVNEEISEKNNSPAKNLENIFKKIFPLISPSLYANIVYEEYQKILIDRKSWESREIWEEMKFFLSELMKNLHHSINELEKKEKCGTSDTKDDETLRDHINWIDNLFYELLEIRREIILPLFKISSGRNNFGRIMAIKEMYRPQLPKTCAILGKNLENFI